MCWLVDMPPARIWSRARIFFPTGYAGSSGCERIRGGGRKSAAKPTAEQLVDQARQERAAVAASAAATTLYTEQTVTTVPSTALSTIQLYYQDELITLIALHKHLQLVIDDECQLTPDIEARAKVLMLPSYPIPVG